MKKQAVWIENSHSVIYEIFDSNFEKVKVTNHEVHHHAKHAKDNHSHFESYFKNILRHIKDHQLIVIGHGQCKEFFKKYVDQHNPDISKRIFAYLTGDQMTDNQVIAKAREAFSNHEMDQALKSTS